MAQATTDLDALLREAEAALAGARSPTELAELRSRYVGRKGTVTTLLRGLGELDPETRREAGRVANQARERIEGWAQQRRTALEAAARARRLAEHRLDVTLPGAMPPRGRLHPVTRIEREMCDFFVSLGYSIEDGPEVDTDRNNFGALNFPDDHPARDLQDTFFVAGDQVLRTHTSNVQIRAMTGRQPPFRFVAPGRVYRHDLDPTHYPMFHQIEAFCVDERASFADLKGTLYAFARHIFGEASPEGAQRAAGERSPEASPEGAQRAAGERSPEVKLRFRAHFFPFTEPSAEMDFWWEGRWLEWGGCGMIHPQVLRNCGIDPARWQGFAFGMGIDRTAMLRWGIPNIHLLFDGDLRVLEQLG